MESGEWLPVPVVEKIGRVPDLKDSVVAKLVDERYAAWQANLPLGDNAALWDYLTVLNQNGRLARFASTA
jgi:ParB family chromosome partitioning protein